MSEESTALARLGGQRVQRLRNAFEEFRPSFERALMGRIDPDHFIEVATTAILNPESKVAECDPRSIMLALRKSAQLNLRPDGEEGALVPRGGRAYFEPMYKGLVRTLLRTGMYTKVEARMVRTGDHFRYQLGLSPVIEHQPAPPSQAGKYEYAYAIVWLRSGQTQFEVMHIEELNEIRATSKRQNKGKESPAWKNHPGEMYRKIPLKRLAKFLELDSEQAAVFRFDDAVATGHDPEPGDYIPEAEWRTLDERMEDVAQGQVDDLKRRLNGEESVPFIDTKVGRGKYADRTWRSLVEAGNGDRGYVTHWAMTAKSGDFLTTEEKEALQAFVRAHDEAEPTEAVTLESLADSVRETIENFDVSFEAKEEVALLLADGNLQGVRDWIDEQAATSIDAPVDLWPEDS